MEKDGLRIWIDLANSPHVLFFKPIIDELKVRGHNVFLTARDFAQTIDLARQSGFQFAEIGKHGGKNLARKTSAILGRAYHLAKYAKQHKIDLAVHHNSYAQAIAAFISGIPSVALMDYEYQPANHISFRLATKVITPAVIPDSSLKQYGLGKKLVRYSGIKEELYLSFHKPNGHFLRNIQLDDDKVIAVVRPAPDMATYHRFENPLFDELLDYLDSKKHVQTLLMPRTKEQRHKIEQKKYINVVVFRDVVDGMDAVFHADLVVTAGGTMGREAAVIGTPAYSIFAGRLGEVDRYLVKTGKLTQIKSSEEFNSIRLKKKPRANFDIKPRFDLVQEITDQILSTVSQNL